MSTTSNPLTIAARNFLTSKHIIAWAVGSSLISIIAMLPVYLVLETLTTKVIAYVFILLEALIILSLTYGRQYITKSSVSRKSELQSVVSKLTRRELNRFKKELRVKIFLSNSRIMHAHLGNEESFKLRLDSSNRYLTLAKKFGVEKETVQDSNVISIIEDTPHTNYLILGDKGAGKTVFLIKLSLFILEKSEINHDVPIPVTLNMREWSISESPTTWITKSLKKLYSTPEDVSNSLLKSGEFVLLLDGLDEVSDNVYASCLNYLNLYKKEYTNLRTIVTSRTEQYLQHNKRLANFNIFEIQPIDRHQILEYTYKYQSLSSLRSILLSNERMMKLSSNPMYFKILIYIFKRPKSITSGEINTHEDNLAVDTNTMIREYIHLQLSSLKSSVDYNLIYDYLRWVAKWMNTNNSDTISISDINSSNQTFLYEGDVLKVNEQPLLDLLNQLSKSNVFNRITRHRYRFTHRVFQDWFSNNVSFQHLENNPTSNVQ